MCVSALLRKARDSLEPSNHDSCLKYLTLSLSFTCPSSTVSVKFPHPWLENPHKKLPMKVQAKVYLHLRALYIHWFTLALLRGQSENLSSKGGSQNRLQSLLLTVRGTHIWLSQNDQQRTKKFLSEDCISQSWGGLSWDTGRIERPIWGPWVLALKSRTRPSWWGRGRRDGASNVVNFTMWTSWLTLYLELVVSWSYFI